MNNSLNDQMKKFQNSLRNKVNIKNLFNLRGDLISYWRAIIKDKLRDRKQCLFTN